MKSIKLAVELRNITAKARNCLRRGGIFTVHAQLRKITTKARTCDVEQFVLVGHRSTGDPPVLALRDLYWGRSSRFHRPRRVNHGDRLLIDIVVY